MLGSLGLGQSSDKSQFSDIVTGEGATLIELVSEWAEEWLEGRADFIPLPRFASRKASATVALTSTTALRTWKPIPTMPLDYSQREENVIPFPTATAGEQSLAHHTPVVLKRPLPVEARCRRSGALVPPSARASTAVVVRPVAKRARKSKRVLADLQFTASVQRSIVALHVETRNSQNVTTDTAVDAMDVEDGQSVRRGIVEIFDREHNVSP